MIGKPTVVADLGEGLGGLDDEVAGFLDPQVAEVFFGGHVEAGLEFSKETRERQVGGFGELGNGNVVAIALVEDFESGTKLLIFCEGSGALVKGTGDSNDAADLSLLIEEWLLGGG